MKTVILALLITLSLTCQMVPDTHASSNEETKRVVNLLAHLRSLDTLTFQFTQTTASEISGRSRNAHGTGTLIRTEDSIAQMRWDYLTPDRQVIISDGKTLSMYFSKLNQMIISSTDALEQDMTYSLFSGNKDITTLFTISRLISEQEIGENSKSLELFSLVPKSHDENIQSLLLWITRNNKIEQIQIKDSFDTLTTLHFSNISENSISPAKTGSLLKFTPPEGTEIIRQ